MRRVVLAMAFALAAAGTRVARADNKDEGRTRFQHGVELYKEGDFRAAVIEFKRAYEAAPNYRILYNLAQTELELQDYAGALVAFRRYLDDGAREVARDRRAQVEAEIRKLERRVARVTVRSSAVGAEVLVDDVVVGRTPLAGPLVVSAGRRKITVTKEGAQRSRALDVAGGDQVAVDLEIDQKTAPPTVVPPPAQPTTTADKPASPPTVVLSPPPEERRSNTSAWIGLGATTVLSAGAVVTGLMALSAKDDFTRRVENDPGARGDIEDARSRTRTLALATDVLGGAAVVAAGVTLVLALSGGSSEKSAEKAGIRLTVRPVADGATLRVTTSF